MLTFASLLWITVFGVDAASLQSPSEESSMRLTRRLKIFESFAKLNDQRDDDFQSAPETPEFHRDYIGSDDDQTVNENIKHSLVELTEIIEGIRTPVIPNESAESLIVFQSLSKMLSNRYPKQSDPFSSWQQYVDESIRNLKCSVKDLCHKFGSNDANFKCNHEGNLTEIRLYGKVGPQAFTTQINREYRKNNENIPYEEFLDYRA